MIHSRSVFYPIPCQFEDQKIFVKRDTLYKRLPKTVSSHFASPQEKSNSLPIHDNYNNLKKKLEEYIQKERHKIDINSLNSTSTNFFKEKSKFIFRKKKGSVHKNSQHSIYTIPSEEIKLSFTENVLNCKNRYENLNLSSTNSQTVCSKESGAKVKIRKAPHFNIKYSTGGLSRVSFNQARDGEAKELGGINAPTLQLPPERTLIIKRKKGKSKAKNDLAKNCQILGKKCKAEVLICSGFTSLEIDDLERKKKELMKINTALKFRSTTKLFLKKRVSQKSNDVGPWSKANQHEEDEITLEQNESSF